MKHSIPKNFLCHLSKKIMLNPVLAADGNNYECEEIEHYFHTCLTTSKSCTSPITNDPIKEILLPNTVLKNDIAEYLKQNPKLNDEIYCSRQLKLKLFSAIKEEKTEIIVDLLDKDQKLLYVPIEGQQTLLDLSCKQSNLGLFQIVLDKCKKAKILKNEEFFPSARHIIVLYLALCLKNMGSNGAQALLDACDWQPQDSEKYIWDLVEKKSLSIDLLNNLLKITLIDLNSKNEDGNTLLHIATKNGHYEAIKLFISKGASAKEINYNGDNAIDIAMDMRYYQLANDIRKMHQEQKLKPFLQPLQEAVEILQHERKTLLNHASFFRQAMNGLKESSIKKLQRTTEISFLKLIDKRFLASGSIDGTIRLWDIRNNNMDDQYKTLLQGHTQKITCMDVLSNDRLISSSLDETLKIWDISSGNCLQTFTRGSPAHLFKKLQNDHLAIVTYRLITIVDPKNPTVNCFELKGHSKQITCLDILSNNCLVSGSDDNTIKLWDTTNGKCLNTIILDKGSSTFCLRKLSDEHFASGHDDGSIKIWDIKSGNCITTLKKHVSWVNQLHLLPNGHLASACFDGTVHLWDAQSYKLIGTLPEKARIVQSLLDGRFATTDKVNSNVIKLWSPLAFESENVFQEIEKEIPECKMM